MAYCAEVTLAGDPYGMHTRPAAAVSEAIRGLDATIIFTGSGKEVAIDMSIPMLSLMQAATDLNLGHGARFRISCKGPQAETAFEALREVLTTSFFNGSLFTVIQV